MMAPDQTTQSQGGYMDRAIDRGLLVAALCMVLSGCVSPGPQSAKEPPAALAAGGPAQAGATHAASATSAPATNATATAAAPTTAAAKSTGKPPPGFKARKRDGELLYCRTVQSTGTHFPEERCWRPEQVEAALLKQQEDSQRLLRERQQSGCRGVDCPN
jgi:hypothetical protein